IGPVAASKKALARAGLTIKDMDVIEINEAFAAQVLACLKGLEVAFDDSRVNPNGGAIAVGHPLGASGARLALTAARQLQRSGGRYALVSLCIGRGPGLAAVLERGEPRAPGQKSGGTGARPFPAGRLMFWGSGTLAGEGLCFFGKPAQGGPVQGQVDGRKIRRGSPVPAGRAAAPGGAQGAGPRPRLRPGDAPAAHHRLEPPRTLRPGGDARA